MTWRLVKLEDTADWPEHGPLRKRGVRTWSHYVYDDESVTYCCELTPSRCLWYVGFTWDLADDAAPLADDENEHWFDFILEHGRPDSDTLYTHRWIDRRPYDDVTKHVDADLLAEHAGHLRREPCDCDQRIADSLREWAVTGEIA